MAAARPTTQAAMSAAEEDLLAYMKSMASSSQKGLRAKSVTSAALRNTSTIARRNADLQADFGFGCNADEHIKYGKCLDGRCMQRLEWEVDKLSLGSHAFHAKDLSLHQACQFSNEIAIRHLLQLGANFNARDDMGRTALHIACQVGPLSTVQQLLAANRGGADAARMDVNAQDSSGCTCLHVAAMANRLEIVQCMLDAGSRWNIPNHNGKIASEVCGRDQRIFQLLKQHAVAHDLADHVEALESHSTALARRDATRERDGASRQLHATRRHLTRPATTQPARK
ncbi:Aste57867_1142 [Aphanomyces stellatus]|uniref:Aste57867_1142 protein n=1 Tax=Aphanomyces stellatus TaxID=120398 RepID=A0A485K4H0_9STRA|nr:hypothetical protein As57867_001141 [Aphanomyces stellatus]VFT78362.1 Aste57867_1142 [Aphanomyces stellatus]